MLAEKLIRFDHLDRAAINARGIEACSRDSYKELISAIVHFGVFERRPESRARSGPNDSTRPCVATAIRETVSRSMSFWFVVVQTLGINGGALGCSYEECTSAAVGPKRRAVLEVFDKSPL